jgi:hypothetical protein
MLRARGRIDAPLRVLLLCLTWTTVMTLDGVKAWTTPSTYRHSFVVDRSTHYLSDASGFGCNQKRRRGIRLATQLYNELASSSDNPLAPQDDLDSILKMAKKSSNRPSRELGGYDPSEGISDREINVGNPQIRVIEKDRSVTSILRELAAIQQQGPQKYCILGTRHCSYLHQQIIELL